ncbi:hypothetical protein [Glaciimonas sp. PAMC28666]|uniref:hypothetical protein n=1 Tax=Glaciimonas sp. PAMC28666 TaxID=2807626 RepID=UPI001963D8C8|nr:hypothetical protein [Glaciimonas sp. PAMC28666]QRX84138.1 hypothetical protein JQN73_08080 [Glaciimonas sp. PAMC28666]
MANFDASAYHQLIGGVRQNAQAICGTLKDNIADAVDCVDESRLKLVLEIACLSDFIAA